MAPALVTEAQPTFYTEEQAKAAREALISKGCPVGNNVCEVFVPNEDMPVWH